jgi:ribonuclease R
MLPEILSNDLCSLKPKEDRLAFSVLFVFSKESVVSSGPFNLKKYSVKTTVINSDKRFSYEEAQKILDTKKGIFYKELSSLNILAKKLAQKNTADGAISFCQEEVKFVLDKDGKPIDVYTKILGETNELIENFMLLANKTVVEYIHKKVPKEERLFLYRVHDKPDKDRVLELVQLLHGLGYTLRTKDKSISSDELNKIIKSSQETPEAGIIQMATIRTMAKAIYSIQNIGHFGLAFQNYTHFTSPIRRYSDLVVHRLIKIYKQGKRVPKKRWCEYHALTADLSEKEKTAMEAERGSIKYKQAEYMSARIGKKFSGTITGVTQWGMFVEESRTKAEGFIRARDLEDDYYIFEKEKMQLRGRKTKKKYRLGDAVEIRVVSSDVDNRMICFKLIT